MGSDKIFLMRAIEIASKSIDSGGGPFGAVIVKSGKLLSEGNNRVVQTTDPTAHAEVLAIREAASVLGTHDLDGCTLYTSCEPCPMCLTAIHWAKIDRVVYGATIEDAAVAGFEELEFPAAELAKRGKSPLIVEHGPYRKVCAELFTEWKKAGLGKSY